MGTVGGQYGSAECFGRRQQMLALLALVGATCTGARAQINVTETGLHDNESVYGLYAPATPVPYENSHDITLFAQGETDPSLYTNLWFRAYGLYSGLSLINTGVIDVNALGGYAISGGGNADAPGPGCAIYGGDYVENTGAIRVTGTGGTAEATDWAQVHGSASGIESSGDVYNSGTLTVTGRGGTTDTGYGANAYGSAEGIGNTAGDVTNRGTLTVAAFGGTAIVSRAYAYADAVGIRTPGDADNTGTIITSASAGTADGLADAYAFANTNGFNVGGIIHNSGAVTVSATGGRADSHPFDPDLAFAYAYADAIGLRAYAGIDNTGVVRASATGGDAGATADASAYSLKAVGSIDNTGALTTDATGGTSHTAAAALAYGIYGEDNVTNGGALAVTGRGGLADAHDLEVLTNADAGAYGICSTNGLIANNGPADVTASGGTALSGIALTFSGNTSASGAAYGLLAADGAIENSRAVTATANGGSSTGTATDAYLEVFALAQAYGLYLPDSHVYNYPDRHIRNSGALVVTATGGDAQGSVEEANASAWAYGIDGYRAPIVNSGRITIAAIGGSALSSSNDAPDEPGAYAGALAYGIRSEEGNVDNSGAIAASGIGGTATGQGAAEATARTEVRGIYVTGVPYVYGDPMQDATNMVQNRAPITVTATGGTAESVASDAIVDVQAFGLTTYYADVINTGDISVTAGGGNGSSAGEVDVFASAVGMSTSSGEANNSGNITAAADAGTSAAGGDAMAWGQAFALGIGADGALRNSGDITVTAHGGSATGGSGTSANAIAIGIQGTALALNNSGAITAAATADPGSNSYAYGIETVGYTSLTNTGVIRATADTAYEVHVTFNTTTLVGTYNVTLDGDPNRAAFGVADGATLALNDATLTATLVPGETLWDTEYKLFETEGTGAVDGNFAEVRAVNPNTTATYHDQGTSGSVDDTVSLAYTPFAATPLAAGAVEKQLITQAGDAVNHHMTTMLLQSLLSPSASGLLASAGSTAESIALAEAAAGKPAGVFVEPYYSLLDHDANPLGYDARLWGFSAGYERYFENTILGLHAGYGHSDIDYTGAGFSGNSEEQDVVTGGFCGLTRWEPWILDYGVTAFYGSHDYEGLTGLSLEERETASYDSYGTAATLMAGHLLRWGPHVFLPEVGLNWLWVHRQRYTTEATDPSWDTTYSALDDHDVYAAAALQWMSSFLHDDIRVTPSVALGVRYLLTDDETGTVVSVPGAAPVLVQSEQDRTVLTLSGALTLTRAPHALSLAYDGDYSPDLQRHSVWLRYTWLF